MAFGRAHGGWCVVVSAGLTVLMGTTGEGEAQGAAADLLAPGLEAALEGAEAPAPGGLPGPIANLAPAPVDKALAAVARKDTARRRNAHCPDDMVEVEGNHCSHLDQKCLRWLDPETQMRCAEFAQPSKCVGKTTRKHFCIDMYEYPNRAGEKPVVMRTWYEARDACAVQGKRLCGDSEWTLACEGQERMPYPYGYARNADACNIDKPHPDPDEEAISDPLRRDAEVARLWQGEASGTRDACVSPFGVHDMTGNVDEWVVNESGKPYNSGLKGGYWGPVRTRCRPMTILHSEIFRFYQIGFRCCADPAGGGEGAPKNRPSRPEGPSRSPKGGVMTNPPPSTAPADAKGTSPSAI